MNNFISYCSINNKIFFIFTNTNYQVLHACAKVDIVRTEIINFSTICQTNQNNKKLVLMTLRKLSRKHLKFIQFSENIEDIYSYVTFFHIFFLTLIQVVSGYMFIDVRHYYVSIIPFYLYF